MKGLFIALIFSITFQGSAQEMIMGPFLPGTEPVSFKKDSIGNLAEGIKPWNLSESQKNVLTLTAGFMVPSLALLQGIVAWNWGNEGKRFGFKSEGWFEQDSYSGGADKTGHMMSHYIQKRFYTWLSSKLGHDHRTSQWHGILAAGLTGLMIEVGDGFSRYQFSPQDLIMDTLGISLAYLLDENPKIDELIGLRWEYWPSQYWFDKKNTDKVDINSDYSGQKFFLSVKATGIPYLAQNWYTRYLTIDFGFYTRGYKPDFSSRPDKNNSQWITYGMGLNLGSLIKDFAPKNSLGEFFSGVTKYWIPPGVVITGSSPITQGPEKF